MQIRMADMEHKWRTWSLFGDIKIIPYIRFSIYTVELITYQNFEII